MERIDWNLPLETDEPTPRPARVVLSDFNGEYAQHHVRIDDINSTLIYPTKNDVPYASKFSPRLRNVRALRTSDECLQRMEALVRRLGDREPFGFSAFDTAVEEAREIVKLLPAPPVDPDLIEARKLVADAYHQDGSVSYAATLDGMRDKDEAISMALAGLQRGRELAAES